MGKIFSSSVKNFVGDSSEAVKSSVKSTENLYGAPVLPRLTLCSASPFVVGFSCLTVAAVVTYFMFRTSEVDAPKADAKTTPQSTPSKTKESFSTADDDQQNKIAFLRQIQIMTNTIMSL